MILVIYHTAIVNQHFVEYLQKTKKDVDIQVLAFDSLKQMQIYDQMGKSTMWQNTEYNIDFAKITGIYNEIYYLNPDNFTDYINSDQEYICSEWSAYLMYVTQKYHQKVYNPFNHHILSGDIFHLPYIYNILEAKGIAVPKIILSMDFEEIYKIFIADNYIPLTDTTEKFSFSRTTILPTNTIGLIEYHEGFTIVVQIVCDRLFCCKILNEEKIGYKLPKTLAQLCIEFTKEMGLKLAEFIFRENLANELILYRFSILPRFNNNSTKNLKNLYDFLITQLQDTT